MNRRHDRGQATVELALAFPLVCLLLLAVVQVAVAVTQVLAVQLAVRDAARAAVVTDDPVRGAASAWARAGPPGASILTDVEGDAVTVTATARIVTDLPLIGALVPDRVVTVTVAMPREPG